jgi:hypothetical protein
LVKEVISWKILRRAGNVLIEDSAIRRKFEPIIKLEKVKTESTDKRSPPDKSGGLFIFSLCLAGL